MRNVETPKNLTEFCEFHIPEGMTYIFLFRKPGTTIKCNYTKLRYGFLSFLRKFELSEELERDYNFFFEQFHKIPHSVLNQL